VSIRCPMPSAGVVILALVGLVILTGDAMADLIVNGDFQSGASGFSSDYTFSPGDIGAPSTYDVVGDPSDSNPYALSYYDHTYGTESGAMLAVNGREFTSDPNGVWSQTVSVAPSQVYLLSIWYSRWFDGPWSASLYVNDDLLLSLFADSQAVGEWKQASASWASGEETTATILVTNPYAAFLGNDFALDDISFIPVSASTDELGPMAWGRLKALFR